MQQTTVTTTTKTILSNHTYLRVCAWKRTRTKLLNHAAIAQSCVIQTRRCTAFPAFSETIQTKLIQPKGRSDWADWLIEARSVQCNARMKGEQAKWCKKHAVKTAFLQPERRQWKRDAMPTRRYKRRLIAVDGIFIETLHRVQLRDVYRCVYCFVWSVLKIEI